MSDELKEMMEELLGQKQQLTAIMEMSMDVTLTALEKSMERSVKLTRMAYQLYIKEGFTEEQALTLTMKMVENMGKMSEVNKSK